MPATLQQASRALETGVPFWNPFGTAMVVVPRTPCQREFQELMQCLRDHHHALCRTKYAQLKECMKYHGGGVLD